MFVVLPFWLLNDAHAGDPLLPLASTVQVDQRNAWFGVDASGAGDVNGDGFADVIVGAWRWGEGADDQGAAFLYLGSAAGLGTTPAWTAESDQDDAEYGLPAAAAGDLNGDGYGDVVVGARAYGADGKAYVYLGSPAGLELTAAWTDEPDQPLAGYGANASCAGDVNGDGYDDLIVGSHQYDDTETDEGAAFVYLGSATGLESSASWTVTSGQANALFGSAVADAGDVNGDGYDDVVVGAIAFDSDLVDEGGAFLYLGSATGLGTTPAWTAESDQGGALFGTSVASAGDVDGDGYDDVVVGDNIYDDDFVDQGRAFLYLGSATGLETTAAWIAEGEEASASFGAAVSSAGDVDADGYDDVIVGSPFLDADGSNRGGAYVFLGSAAGLAATAVWSATSDQDEAYFGMAVSSAGDVDGDGRDEVVVGAPAYDDPELDEGAVFVYMSGGDGGPDDSGTADDSGTTDDSGTADDSGGGDVGDGDAGGGGDDGDETDSGGGEDPGCGCGGTSGGAGPFAILILAALALRRRDASVQLS